MNTTLERAFTAFKEDTSRSEKAENAINTLTTCFGEANVDVVRAKAYVEEEYESTLRNMLERDASEEEVLDYLKRYKPFLDIIIKFPHEVITNEYGKKTEIYDFFVKVTIKYDGTFSDISAIKSTYTEDQLFSGYVHSHCPSVERSTTGVREWKGMCFGSGPINNTMSILRSRLYDDRLWMAFVAELRQWVRTESTDGGPYFRMSNIHTQYKEVTSVYRTRPDRRMKEWMVPLIKSYIRSRRLKVGFIKGRFCLGTTFTEWLLDFSKYAEVWATREHRILPFRDTLILNNKLCERYSNATTNSSFRRLEGAPVLTFKGETVNLKIIEGVKVEHYNLLDYRIGFTIAKALLDTLNYSYDSTDTTNTTIPAQWQ